MTTTASMIVLTIVLTIVTTKDGSNESGHKLEYGLCGKAYSETSPHACADCQLPFKFFSDLKRHVDLCHHSLLKD